eukprot:2914447-Rhodomonas_salina.3
MLPSRLSHVIDGASQEELQTQWTAARTNLHNLKQTVKAKLPHELQRILQLNSAIETLSKDYTDISASSLSAYFERTKKQLCTRLSVLLLESYHLAADYNHVCLLLAVAELQ